MQMVSNSKRVVNKTGEELNGSAVPSKISNFGGLKRDGQANFLIN